MIPRCHTSAGRLSSELGEHAIGFVQNVPLLFDAHVGRVLVRIAMKANLMSRVADGGHLLREGFEGMTWNEPCCLDSVLVKELQKAS